MSRVGEAEDLLAECRDLAERAKSAARELAIAPGGAKDRWLRRSAEAIRERSGEILEANARDVDAAPGLGLNPAAIDRLKTRWTGEQRIQAHLTPRLTANEQR